MPDRPIRPGLQERYDRRQQEIVATAASVFAQRGYDQTTMQELARQLGLATGALYHYFGSKEQLLIAICDAMTEPILAQARKVSAGDEPAADRLRTLVRIWVAHVIEYQDHTLVFQQERHVIEADEQWRRVRASRKSFERIVGRLLDEARPDATRPRDRRIALGALLGMVNHTANWCRPGGRVGADDIADGYLSLLLNGSDQPPSERRSSR
jgi:AcrR family transcriptional regulator